MAAEKSPNTHPIGLGTTNMVVNVKKEFRDACFEAACDARMKLSDWMRAAFLEKIERVESDREQLKLKGVA